MNRKQNTRRLTRVLATVGLLFAGGTAMSYEQPEYTVVYTDGDVEYRQYEPYLVSETVIKAADGYRDAGGEGFRRLFRYITGANFSQAEISMTAPVQQARSEKIAMTVPVQQSGDDDEWIVAFMLPSQYTLETAPVPSDNRVYVREVPGRLMAVRQFSGRWRDANFGREERELAAAVEGDGVGLIGSMERAAYNGPFTLPFMRRNEVMVAVDRVPDGIVDDIRLAAQP